VTLKPVLDTFAAREHEIHARAEQLQGQSGVAELRRANEILKAASAYFASELDPTRRRSAGSGRWPQLCERELVDRGTSFSCWRAEVSTPSGWPDCGKACGHTGVAPSGVAATACPTGRAMAVTSSAGTPHAHPRDTRF
jgi:hypothetical protein